MFSGNHRTPVSNRTGGFHAACRVFVSLGSSLWPETATNHSARGVCCFSLAARSATRLRGYEQRWLLLHMLPNGDVTIKTGWTARLCWGPRGATGTQMAFMSVRRTETLVPDAWGTVYMTTKMEINSKSTPLNSLISSLYILILRWE